MDIKEKMKNWWVIIRYDSWLARSHGAYDIKIFGEVYGLKNEG